jgi:hypothetical protein
MNFKYVGPLLLLAALVVGDQIRINRPNHKYRLTVEVETPQGVRSASGIMAVHPDRSYSRGGKTTTKGDAVFVDLGGGKNLVALLAHRDKTLELDEINYVALRAYKAAGRNVSFNQMSQMTGMVPVTGEVIPVLVSFSDPADPATARLVPPDAIEGALGKGIRLRGVSAEVVPNGVWPLDFGGPLGDPVSRGIAARLPGLNGTDDAAGKEAGKVLQAAGLRSAEAIDSKDAFTRK